MRVTAMLIAAGCFGLAANQLSGGGLDAVVPALLAIKGAVWVLIAATLEVADAVRQGNRKD